MDDKDQPAIRKYIVFVKIRAIAETTESEAVYDERPIMIEAYSPKDAREQAEIALREHDEVVKVVPYRKGVLPQEMELAAPVTPEYEETEADADAEDDNLVHPDDDVDVVESDEDDVASSVVDADPLPPLKAPAPPEDPAADRKKQEKTEVEAWTQKLFGCTTSFLDQLVLMNTVVKYAGPPRSRAIVMVPYMMCRRIVKQLVSGGYIPKATLTKSRVHAVAHSYERLTNLGYTHRCEDTEDQAPINMRTSSAYAMNKLVADRVFTEAKAEGLLGSGGVVCIEPKKVEPAAEPQGEEGVESPLEQQVPEE